MYKFFSYLTLVFSLAITLFKCEIVLSYLLLSTIDSAFCVLTLEFISYAGLEFLESYKSCLPYPSYIYLETSLRSFSYCET